MDNRCEEYKERMGVGGVVGIVLLFAGFFLFMVSDVRNHEKEQEKTRQVVVDSLGEEWLRAETYDLVESSDGTLYTFLAFQGSNVLAWPFDQESRVEFPIKNDLGLTLIKRGSPDYLTKVERSKKQI